MHQGTHTLRPHPPTTMVAAVRPEGRAGYTAHTKAAPGTELPDVTTRREGQSLRSQPLRRGAVGYASSHTVLPAERLYHAPTRFPELPPYRLGCSTAIPFLAIALANSALPCAHRAGTALYDTDTRPFVTHIASSKPILKV